MSNHKNIQDDEEFATVMQSAGGKLVVVDYNATWCGPCQKIHPVYTQLAKKYPNALFLGVDVDRCREIAMQQNVSSLPTFIFYRNGTKIDQMKGADAAGLEAMIKKHYGSEESGELSVGGFSDLLPFIEHKGCECLNESDTTPFKAFIEGKSPLTSDCDEQLILVYGFNQNIKLQAIKIKADPQKGPKSLKLFINLPNTLDFDAADGMTPTQEIVLTEEDLKGENPVQLRYVKFQSVNNLQIFIPENQSGSDTTTIEAITLYGAPVSTTNMQDFKRIAGKQGESH